MPQDHNNNAGRGLSNRNTMQYLLDDIVLLNQHLHWRSRQLTIIKYTKATNSYQRTNKAHFHETHKHEVNSDPKYPNLHPYINADVDVHKTPSAARSHHHINNNKQAPSAGPYHIVNIDETAATRES